MKTLAELTECSMAFSDLLDSISTDPIPTPAAPDLDLADLVMFAVSRRVGHQPEPLLDQVTEQAAEPAMVSRFAAAGLDDDLLPVSAPRRRRFHL